MSVDSILDLDCLQDDFVRAVLYPFAMADYEGQDSVSMSAVAGSEILEGLPTLIVDEALGTAQRAGLIAWDEARVGTISLTPLGFAKFRLVRHDFFNDDRNDKLREDLIAIDPPDLQRSEEYRSIKQECSGLGVYPGQPCPVAGTWFARRLPNVLLIMQEGETFPINPVDSNGNPIIWYWKRGKCA